MKRIKLCVCILAAVMAFCGFSLWSIYSDSLILSDYVSQIKTLSEDEKTEEALAVCENFSRFWKSYYTKLSLLVKRDKLSEINASIAKIKPYIECDNDELSAELDSILYQINWIWDTEIPSLTNVF